MVENRHKRYRLNERLIETIAIDIVRMIRKENCAELEFIFVNDAEIKRFNKAYKGRDRATDVLSFGIDRSEFGEKKFLGQIIISLDTARRNAREFRTVFTDEIVLYVVHGILHLFGYDDRSGRESARMTKKQTEIMERLVKCRNLSKVLMMR